MMRKNKKVNAPKQQLNKQELCKQLDMDPQHLVLINNYAINLQNQKKQVRQLIHQLVEENERRQQLKSKRIGYEIKQQFPLAIETALSEPCHLLWSLSFPQSNKLQDKRKKLESISKMIKQPQKQQKQSHIKITHPELKENSELQLFLQHIEQRTKFLRNKLTKYNRIIEQKHNEEQQEEKRKKIILRLMQKNIISMEKFIFLDSITAIVEIPSTNRVKVYFQQSYSSKIMEKNTLKSIIGTNQYDYFRSQAQKYERLFKYQQQQFYVSCHYCRQIIRLKSDIFQCQMKLTVKSMLSTPYTNPQIFYRTFLDPYNNKSDVKPSDQYYCHPYLRYWHFYRIKNSDQIVPFCNKVYCSECYLKLRKKFSQEMNIQKIEKKKSAKKTQRKRKRVNKKFTLNESNLSIKSNKKIKPQDERFCCLYCAGFCNCRRCIKGQQLITSMAYYQLYGGNMHQLKDCFVFPSSQGQCIIQYPILTLNIIKDRYYEEKKKIRIKANDWNTIKKFLASLDQVQTCKRQSFEKDFYNLTDQCDIIQQGYKMKGQLWDMSERAIFNIRSQQPENVRQTPKQRRENQLLGQRTIFENEIQQEENFDGQYSGEQDQQIGEDIHLLQNIQRFPINDDGQGAPLGIIYNRYQNQEDVQSEEFSADSSISSVYSR